MISDNMGVVESKTVMEIPRKAAGLSQRQLTEWAWTQQSSVSEYEARSKSPTLEVVERLVAAADHELAVKPLVAFDYLEDPDAGGYLVPDRLWQVPIPTCYARVTVFYFSARSWATTYGISPCSTTASSSTTGASRGRRRGLAQRRGWGAAGGGLAEHGAFPRSSGLLGNR